MKTPIDFDQLLAPVRAAARELTTEQRIELYVALARVQAELLMLAPPTTAPEPARDRQLSPAQAARIIGRSKDWLYRNRASLPRTLLPSGRWTISESKLRKWLEARSRG